MIKPIYSALLREQMERSLGVNISRGVHDWIDFLQILLLSKVFNILRMRWHSHFYKEYKWLWTTSTTRTRYTIPSEDFKGLGRIPLWFVVRVPLSTTWGRAEQLCGLSPESFLVPGKHKYKKTFTNQYLKKNSYL